MSQQNICHFIPFHKDYHSIHTIHFVLETQPQIYEPLRSEAVYKVFYVKQGQGRLHTAGAIHPLAAGDLFFSFPATPYAIESVDHFEFLYISFLGARANMVLDKLKINKHNHIFHHFHHVEDFWLKGIAMNTELSDLISESVLLYTFSCLGETVLSPVSQQLQSPNAALIIKKYIDDHFTDPDFSIDSVSKELLYNKKYISTVFKKAMGIGISEYLNTIRIQHACTMMEQGFTSVSDISFQCGFSDPQYFSKLFKKRMSLSPTQYMKHRSDADPLITPQEKEMIFSGNAKGAAES